MLRLGQLSISVVACVIFLVAVTYYVNSDTGDTAPLWGFESGTNPEEAARRVYASGRYLVLEVALERPDGSTRVLHTLNWDCTWPNGSIPLETQSSRPIRQEERESFYFAEEFARRFNAEMTDLVWNSPELPCR